MGEEGRECKPSKAKVPPTKKEQKTTHLFIRNKSKGKKRRNRKKKGHRSAQAGSGSSWKHEVCFVPGITLIVRGLETVPILSLAVVRCDINSAIREMDSNRISPIG